MHKLLIGLLLVLSLSGCSQENEKERRKRAERIEKMESFYSTYDLFKTLQIDGLPSQVPYGKEAYKGDINPIIRIRAISMNGEDRKTYSSGSGFFITRKNKTYIMTAYHVLSDGFIFEFLDDEKRYLDVQMGRIFLFPSLDAALVELKSCSAKFTPLRMGKDTRLFDKVFSVGFPQGITGKMETEGVVLRSQLEASTLVQPGMSGGPLLNENNEVVGINSLKNISGGKVGGIFSDVNDVFYLFERESDTK